MNKKELDCFTINYINEKIKKDEKFVKYSFYEIRVLNNLSADEVDIFLRINKDYFENKGYKVYFTGEEYVYNDETKTVQDNELMIAIKQ